MILAIYKKNKVKDKLWSLMSYAWDLKTAEKCCLQFKTQSTKIGLNDVQSVIQSFDSIDKVPSTLENPAPEKMLYN
jgi:hypothetical protein